MRIGGLIKHSFIDWAGKITAVIFTKGCNFRCGYCHNPELVYPQLIDQTQDLSEKEIFEFLSKRKNWLDGVVITGGEPTLQSDLRDFIFKLKNMGFAVKLDTNGSSPMVLKDLIKSNLVDFVAMDVKTILDLKEYQRICRIQDSLLLLEIEKSIGILKESGVDYQLRTTVLPQFHTEQIMDELQKKFSYCNYQLQEYRETKIIVNAR